MHHPSLEREREMCALARSSLYHTRCCHCLRCHPRDYIRLVQHLIEKCLTLYMDREDCIRALAKHARIHPVVTIAVWDGLLKENPAFFIPYFETLRRRRWRRAPPRSMITANSRTSRHTLRHSKH